MEALTQTSTGGSEAEEARTDKAREERDRRRGGAKEGADARVERRRTAEERRQEDRTAEEMVVAVADIGDHCGRARSGWMAVGGGRKPTSDDDDVARVPSPLYRSASILLLFHVRLHVRVRRKIPVPGPWSCCRLAPTPFPDPRIPFLPRTQPHFLSSSHLPPPGTAAHFRRLPTVPGNPHPLRPPPMPARPRRWMERRSE